MSSVLGVSRFRFTAASWELPAAAADDAGATATEDHPLKLLQSIIESARPCCLIRKVVGRRRLSFSLPPPADKPIDSRILLNINKSYSGNGLLRLSYAPVYIAIANEICICPN